MSRFSRGFGSDLVSILGSGSNLDFLAAAVTHEMKNALVCHDWNRLFMSMDNASNLAPVGVVQMAGDLLRDRLNHTLQLRAHSMNL